MNDRRYDCRYGQLYGRSYTCKEGCWCFLTSGQMNVFLYVSKVSRTAVPTYVCMSEHPEVLMYERMNI